MKVSTVEQMRELDARAIEEFAIPDQILMENAGLAAFTVIQRELGSSGLRCAVVCGLGNNGGDGLVVARKLHSAGADVRVLVVGDPGRFSGCSRANLEMVARAGIEVVPEVDGSVLEGELEGCHLVVDALLGTGLTRDVGGRYREVVEVINRSLTVVASIDIPSGVDGNTGRVRGVAVEADLTVTFGLPKLGNLLLPGFELGGRLFVTHISFPPQLTDAAHLGVEVELPPPLPPRPAHGHKGSFGDVLFVAGAASYFGAPSLAALSLLKAGGGYARLAAPRSLVPHLAPLASEVVFAPQDETSSGSLAASAESGILELAREVDVVVLGPGLSLEPETQDLVRRLTAAVEAPLLVDGDGLTALAAADPATLRERSAATVLTPHPGEMARLLGRDVGEVVADPVGAARECAASFAATVVLKGAHSLIADAEGRIWINPSGCSGMATAGSGDVLTGTVAAMRGLGLELEDAVRAGVFVHGLAGDLAAEAIGEDGVTARDIMDHLPAAVRTFRDDYEELADELYGVLEVV